MAAPGVAVLCFSQTKGGGTLHYVESLQLGLWLTCLLILQRITYQCVIRSCIM